MAQQKTNPKLEQALTRGDLAIRQANSGRATAVLRALGKMIIEASATIGVQARSPAAPRLQWCCGKCAQLAGRPSCPAEISTSYVSTTNRP